LVRLSCLHSWSFLSENAAHAVHAFKEKSLRKRAKDKKGLG